MLTLLNQNKFDLIIDNKNITLKQLFNIYKDLVDNDRYKILS